MSSGRRRAARQSILAVDPHVANPGQVVEADVAELHVLRLDAEARRQPALEADGHIAQAHGPVAGIQQRLGDDPDGVGEVDQPAPCGAALAGQLGQLEDSRDGTQCLGEPAGARGFLADRAEGDGTVSSVSRACWPPMRS